MLTMKTLRMMILAMKTLSMIMIVMVTAQRRPQASSVTRSLATETGGWDQTCQQ